MRFTAIVPVKRFDAAKARLGDVLDAEARAILAEAMLEDVLDALARCESLERIVVVTGDPRAREIAASRGAELLDDPDDRGHSDAALIGVRFALRSGAGTVALLPGDCPLLDAAELDRHLASLPPGTAGVIPDRDGSGTNGLLLRPPDAIAPAFGPGSRERHLELARAAAVDGRVLDVASLALDLDNGSDLDALRARIARAPGRAPATAEALGRMDAALS